MKYKLEIIKNANIDADSADAAIRDIIRAKTDNYTNPNNLSNKKMDMSDYATKTGCTIEDYTETFGSVMRSEQDVVDALAARYSPPTSPLFANEIALLKLYANQLLMQ